MTLEHNDEDRTKKKFLNSCPHHTINVWSPRIGLLKKAVSGDWRWCGKERWDWMEIRLEEAGYDRYWLWKV